MPAPKWQPIETAPTDGTPPLLYWRDLSGSWNRSKNMPRDIAIGVCEGGMDIHGRWVWTGFEHEQLRPTHWMPLPKPPKAKGNLNDDRTHNRLR